MPSRKKPPAKLLADIERNRARARHFDEKGQHDTVYHKNLVRLESALADYEKPKKSKAEKELDVLPDFPASDKGDSGLSDVEAGSDDA